VAVDPEEEHGKGRGVDDAQAVCLSRHEGERGVLVEADSRPRCRRRTRLWSEVGAILGKVDEAGVW
jgi:hypothetical protein